MISGGKKEPANLSILSTNVIQFFLKFSENTSEKKWSMFVMLLLLLKVVLSDLCFIGPLCAFNVCLAFYFLEK